MRLNAGFYIIFFALVLPFPALAQTGRPNIPTGGPPGSASQQDFVDPPDTLDFSYLYSDNPGQEYPYRDTSLDAGLWQYDPIRKQQFDYAHLGNLGSAHQPIVYRPSFRRGFDLGYHQFDLYKLKLEDLPYYRLRDAFTNAFFSQGPLQTDAYFKAQFSRNFGKTLNYTLDYQRINNGGAYATQRATNTAFGTGFWYRGPGGRYESFTSYRTNVIRQEDNGGIRPELINETNGAQEFSIPVFLNSASTHHDQRAIAYTQYFRLGGVKKGATARTQPQPSGVLLPDSLRFRPPPADSLLAPDSTSLSRQDSGRVKADSLLVADTLASGQSSRPDPFPPASGPTDNKRAFIISHQLQFERGIFKFSDGSPASDSVYYRDLQVDQRGLRNYLTHRMFENALKISTSRRRKGKTSEQLTGSQRDLFELGLHHTLHKIEQEPRDSSLNNLFLTGRWNFTPSDRLLVQTYAHYGLWDNRGDYRLSGRLFFDFAKAGTLELEGLTQRFEPSLLENRIYITQQEVWNHRFKKRFETSLSASYRQPLTGTRLSGRLQLVSNYIYFDTLAFPVQDEGTIRILQFMVEQRLRLGKFHSESGLVIQDISGDKLRLPGLYFKQSLYYETKIFKKVLDMTVGLDLRINSAYFANNYQPLTGQFHLQDQQQIGSYPAADFFVAFKVKYFRAFFRWENLTAYLRDDFFYQIANYPYPFDAIRFGINWQLLN